ncbi:hypothetical protein [Novosphingobium kaempferiae]|uniref:hypothetical protein n=1 Tax=Novosphingobium kaempferiae TaxID=2896849 RepID=UPI001E64E7F8|nr:hypothetical protein [Novosphingobium kaempferiae]
MVAIFCAERDADPDFVVEVSPPDAMKAAGAHLSRSCHCLLHRKKNLAHRDRLMTGSVHKLANQTEGNCVGTGPARPKPCKH